MKNVNVDIQRRRNPNKKKPKKIISISLSGDEGYEALRVLNDTSHIYGKSGLVIDLAICFNKFKKVYGVDDSLSDDEILAHIMMKMDLEGEK